MYPQRQVIRVQKRRSKISKASELANLDAEIEASEPVWRAKGASLKAEVRTQNF